MFSIKIIHSPGKSLIRPWTRADFIVPNVFPPTCCSPIGTSTNLELLLTVYTSRLMVFVADDEEGEEDEGEGEEDEGE